MAGGRPSSYKPEFCEQARKLCVLGANDDDLAAFFGVNRTTLWRWVSEFKEFCNALKVAKEEANDRVERSLYHRATGYTFDAVKIFQFDGEPVIVPYKEHVPPDTTAMIFWLKNRRPEQWREKSEHHTFHHKASDLTDDELSRIATGSSNGAPQSPKDSPKPH